MNNFKSHFVFSRKQRSGIFLLILIIVSLQLLILNTNNNVRKVEINPSLVAKYDAQIDSLKQVKINESQPTIYPFNPNFITDYKGYTLGMTTAEIDRLLQFRANDKWVNSAKEFQNVTLISDSLLDIISPFFKFPEWVSNSYRHQGQLNNDYSKKFSDDPKPTEQKIDLNKATAAQLQRVYGIGEKLSQRIIEYRDIQPDGFIADIQLTEVYGITTELAEKITNHFTVKTPAQINKINLNSAKVEELVTIKYIDYEVAYNIIETRTLRDGFQSLDELTKVKDFPIHKLEIIKLYLTL
ncbi:helix-hairpin-helix domain-containing protein [Paucihalobacter ruber]|uniref:Helix-hairpin-helix domain-containing protein n=1 Tax=Paucihalobacter ruber TaxID=2567861 RepID=A0A506PQK6_9FLAO|nr:helix-hairpin-helix domain-containing protein [Paucihalobacter ruber]TPV35522.1 helix-hairpin-helix domain-containing protein [Paucihalobacter ruber]